MSDVQTLAQQWLAAKAAEQEAVAHRHEIEKQLVGIVGAKPEGSQTHKVGPFAIEVTGRMSYACADLDRLALLRPDLVRPALHESALKKLRVADPKAYTALANLDLITVKPSKTGVTVKLLEAA